MGKRSNKNNNNRRRSGKQTSTENLGNLKIQPRRDDGPERSSQDFPDMSGFESMSYKKYFAEMKVAPLDVVDRCQTALFSLDTNFLRQRYELMALNYGFAMIVRDDEALMASFRAKPFWKDRRYKPNKNILRMVFQYCLMTSKGDPKYHRACTYARALSGFFNDNVPMEQIPSLIEEAGGIEKLAELNKKSPKEEDVQLAPDKEYEDDSSDTSDNSNSEVEDDDQVEVRPQADDDLFGDLDHGDASSSRPRAAAVFRPPKLAEGEYIYVAMTPAQEKKTLRCGNEETHEVLIKATVSGKDGEFRKVVATKVTRLD